MNHRKSRARLLANGTNAIFRRAGLLMLLAAVPLAALQGNNEKAGLTSSQSKPAANGTTAASARNDHVGKPLPDYMTGDQCLFCHRNVVGPTWQTEPHAWTIRTTDIPPLIPQ